MLSITAVLTISLTNSHKELYS